MLTPAGLAAALRQAGCVYAEEEAAIMIEAAAGPGPAAVQGCDSLLAHMLEQRRAEWRELRAQGQVDEEALMKYRNPSRSIKPLYGVDFLHGCRDAFVCEGVFSAISATRYSDQFSALCTYGKTVKDVHVPIFSELPVDRYWLAYDGGEFWALLKGARQLYRSGKAVRIVFLPFETDPNDLSEAELKKAVDSHSLKYNDVSHQFLIWASKQFDLRDADGWEDLQREVVCVKKEVSGEFHP